MNKILISISFSVMLIHPLAAQDDGAAQAEMVFQHFLTAMTNTDVDTVISLFAEDALFWGTGSQSLVTTPAGVLAYFEPVGRNEPGQNIARAKNFEVRMLGDNLVMISGMWEVVQIGEDSGVPLRVSLLLAKRDNIWKIIQFHNSAVPG